MLPHVPLRNVAIRIATVVDESCLSAYFRRIDILESGTTRQITAATCCSGGDGTHLFTSKSHEIEMSYPLILVFLHTAQKFHLWYYLADVFVDESVPDRRVTLL